MKTKKKKMTLTAKALLSLLLFVVLIVVFSGLGIILNCYGEVKENYRIMTFSHTHTAAEYIDGDAIKRYYETNEKDDYYYTILKYLRAAKEQSDLKYFYVYVPLEDEIVYIWDADNSVNTCDLGYREPHNEYGLQVLKQAFRKDPVEEIVITNNDVYGFTASACSPIFDSTGEPIALVAVDMEMERFTNTLVNYILSVVSIVIIISVLSLFVLYFVMRRSIIRPIEVINNSAKKMVDNLESNESTHIEMHTGDELEELAGSFNQMDLEVREFLKRLASMTAERERVVAELSLATNIQTSMLPNIFPAFPNRPEFDIYASMKPAKEVGGDFYDFFFIDEKHLALVIADVSGKGVPAALFMMSSKILINTLTMMIHSPARTLERVNEQICMNNVSNMFVTVWLGILDVDTGKLGCSDAGHEYPAVKQNGKFELIHDKHGIAVGASNKVKYTEYELQLQKGDSIFVYTDGVAEATNANEELFGTERTVDALNISPDASPKEILTNVHTSVNSFVKEAPQFDDLTMLCLTYCGPDESQQKPEGNE